MENRMVTFDNILPDVKEQKKKEDLRKSKTYVQVDKNGNMEAKNNLKNDDK